MMAQTIPSLFLLLTLGGATVSGFAQESAATPVPSDNNGNEIQLTTRPTGLDLKTVFTVKYVAADAVYLSGGKSTGLAAGLRLTIKRPRPLSAGQPGPNEKTDAQGNLIVAEVEVATVAASSTVCEISHKNLAIQPGDLAYVSVEDAEMIVQKRETSSARKYPQVITFTEGDPLDEEVRDAVPRPPLPEVNRMKGRVGLDYSGLISHGSTSSSYSQLGMVARVDFTRIGGTYWNLNGYWRGRMTSNSQPGQQTLQDLLNRTYTLSLQYANPTSNWVAGFGRLYLPWATSLDTIDGGYIGRKLGHGMTSGIFAGSTPDPTSWDYNPNRREAGMFVALERGSFDNVRFTTTVGGGLSTVKWEVDKPFLFMENGLFYKRLVSVYSAVQADDPQGPNTYGVTPGPGLSRAFVTVRVQPLKRVSFDGNYNYFRDVPTFDPRLIPTGLIDTLLFQGFSGGVRVEVLPHIFVYTNLGKSNESGDASSSWNQMYGATWNNILHTSFRLDGRYSKYDSSFGKGTYRSITLSRNMGERLMGQIQFGDQSLTSAYTVNDGSWFINSLVDANLGRHYFFEGGYTLERGGQLNYDQWFVSMGYRFDNRSRAK